MGIQPHTRVLRVLVGKFSTPIKEAVPMPLEPLGEHVFLQWHLLLEGCSAQECSFFRCVAKRKNREKRSVPLDRASRTAALSL